jgi:ATP-dependent protease ClpP protease subunit
VIVGRLKGEDTMTEQAYRYDMSLWTKAEAQAHCKNHDGRFEAGVKPAAAARRFELVEDEEPAAACGCHVAEDCARIVATGRALPQAPPTCSGGRCEIRAADDGPVTDLFIDGPIGGWAGIDLSALLADMRAIPSTTPIRVFLNSPGGNVFDGLALYNTLRQRPAVEVHVTGLAASIASVIAMAGQRLYMADASMLMIHEPHAGVLGTAEDMRKMAELLDQTAGLLAEVYVRKSGAERPQVRAWMAAETWFTAQQALDAKFADVVTDTAPQAALAAASAFDLSAFKHPPTWNVQPVPLVGPRASTVARARVFKNWSRLAALAAYKEVRP